VSVPSFKPPKNIKYFLNTNKKDKNDLKIISIRHKCSYKFEKKITKTKIKFKKPKFFKKKIEKPVFVF
jgi:hypothetical protein